MSLRAENPQEKHKNREEYYSWQLTLREGPLRAESKGNSITLGRPSQMIFLRVWPPRKQRRGQIFNNVKEI